MIKQQHIPKFVITLICFATAAMAANPPTVVINLTGVSGGSLAGVYTSPYIGNINGGVSIPVICDDFSDDSYTPETWTAYDTNLSTLGPDATSAQDDSFLKWGTDANPTLSLSQTQAYDVAAYMVTELLAPASSGLNSNDLSFAIWGLFDNAAFSSISGADLTNAKTYLNNAVTAVGSPTSQASYSNVNIYSYVPNSGVTNCGGCSPPPQEFIVVSMSEAPSPALLGLYLLGLGALVFFLRRHVVRMAN